MQNRIIRTMGAAILAVGVLAQPAIGESEATGSKGESEVAGSKGESEVAGSKGESEIAGSKGESEVAGSKGESEIAGSKGESEVAGSKGESEIAGSKREIISELLTIVGIVGGAEQIRDQQSVMELMQMQPSYHEMMEWATSEQPDLGEEDRQLLLARLDDFDAFAERFRTLFNERLDFSTIIETVYPPLYAKIFSEAELRQIVAFYRTPVGRKTIEVMPSLMQEAAAGLGEAVRPHALGLVQEIVAEERAKLAD